MQASLPEANPGGQVSPFSRILVPIDGSDASLRAATVAIRMAAVHALPVLAIYVLDVASLDQVGAASREGAVGLSQQLEGKGRRYLDYVQAVAKRYGVDCTTLLLRGIPHARITEVARDRGIDLVVLGASINPGRSRALTGSTACEVIASVPCSVLFVK